MKVAVFSDTHGSLARLPMVLAALPALDAVLHLGDFAGDGDAIAESLSVPCYAVRGNCDFRGNAPWERVAELGGARLLLTHGHRYSGLYALALAAEAQRCNAVLFGHTHSPLLTAQGACLIVNPGSLSRPRGSAPGYALLTIEGGEVKAELRSL